MVFHPARVIFEPGSLNYPLGKKLYNLFQERNVEISFTGSHNRVTSIPGKTKKEAYREAKRTLVVGVRRGKNFQTCKPSAHYQLPISTSCPGKCEYCYLLTTLGHKPYLRIYVNIEDILKRAQHYIDQRKPELTVFEGAATSDPVPVEPYTGSLAKVISYFGKEPFGRFRVATKFTEVESLLNLKHNGRTRFRFSINTEDIIRSFEHSTPPLDKRIAASRKIALAGYPLGFIIAPVFLNPGWEEKYRALLRTLSGQLKEAVEAGTERGITFEIITHRFSKRAKKAIMEISPHTALPLEETDRTYKYGQFGYGKYLYPPETLKAARTFFEEAVNDFFPGTKIEYFV